ncbi:MAG: hypothetical protein KatS3mg111_0284 [Pirellulaceae bacterium]|nr:MAG: hypothetical protein KatS3mg111_0284 [Pirellulaceae bacterium]
MFDPLAERSCVRWNHSLKLTIVFSSRLGRRSGSGGLRSRDTGRIPDKLWDWAGQVARKHGVAKTAGALKLDYYTLQRRMDSRGGAPSKAADAPKKCRRGGAGAFVELAPVTNISPQAECELEFENGSGTKLTLRWKGSTPPDLATLSKLVRQE